MRTRRRSTLAAVVVAAAAAAATVTVAGCSGDAEPAARTGDGSPTPGVASPLGWTPVPPDSEGTLPRGRYGLTANGFRGMPWAVLAVPGSLSSKGEWLLNDEESGSGGVGYWTVTGVYRDPCRKAAGLLDVGSDVEGLAAALGQQEVSRVTDPVPVTLDGYQGLYLEVQAPESIDFAECGYDVWDSTPGGGRYMQEPGQVDRIWIVDVEDDVVVLHATVWSSVSASAIGRLTDMVESVDFVPRT